MEVTIPDIFLGHQSAENKSPLINQEGKLTKEDFYDHEFDLSELLELQEFYALNGPLVDAHILIIEQSAFKKLHIAENMSDLEKFTDEFENIRLNCPGCGAPLGTDITTCSSCRAIVTWQSDNEMVKSLQKQIFYWKSHQHIVNERLNQLGVMALPGDHAAHKDIAEILNQKTSYVKLLVKAFLYKNGEQSIKALPLGCPSCGGPLASPTYCSSCKAGVIYSDYTINDLINMDDDVFAEIEEKEEKNLLVCMEKFIESQENYPFHGGFHFMFSTDYGNYFHWQFELERARAVCTTIQYIKQRGKNRETIKQDITSRFQTKKINNFDPITSMAIIPRCKKCSSQTDTFLREDKHEKADFCNCEFCGSDYQYGSEETDFTILKSYADHLRTTHSKTLTTVKIYLGQIASLRQKGQGHLDAYVRLSNYASFLDMVRDYIHIPESANIFIQHFNERYNASVAYLNIDPDIADAVLSESLTPSDVREFYRPYRRSN